MAWNQRLELMVFQLELMVFRGFHYETGPCVFVCLHDQPTIRMWFEGGSLKTPSTIGSYWFTSPHWSNQDKNIIDGFEIQRYGEIVFLLGWSSSNMFQSQLFGKLVRPFIHKKCTSKSVMDVLVKECKGPMLRLDVFGTVVVKSLYIHVYFYILTLQKTNKV